MTGQQLLERNHPFSIPATMATREMISRHTRKFYVGRLMSELAARVLVNESKRYREALRGR